MFPIPKKKIHIELDPESIRTHNTIRALANENAELKGKVARYEVDEGKRRERKKDMEEEEEVKLYLDKKKKEIIRKTTPKCFSLKSFFNKLARDRNFREKLYITSFDRESRLGKFGDFGITSDGDFLILDSKNNVVAKMQKLNDIFQSVGALKNDVSSGKIPVNFDDEGGYIENIMVYEASEFINVDDKLKFKKARKRPVYEIIAEKNDIISDLQKRLEESELLNIELQNKNDELERVTRVNENSAKTARADLSKAEQRISAIERIFGDMEKELIQRRQIHTIEEENIDQLENVVTEMRKKAEGEEQKTNFAKAMELISNIKSQLIREMPEPQVIVREPEKVVQKV